MPLHLCLEFAQTGTLQSMAMTPTTAVHTWRILSSSFAWELQRGWVLPAGLGGWCQSRALCSQTEHLVLLHDS